MLLFSEDAGFGWVPLTSIRAKLLNLFSHKTHYLYTGMVFMADNKIIKKQLSDCSKTLEGIRSKTSSSEEACLVLRNYLS